MERQASIGARRVQGGVTRCHAVVLGVNERSYDPASITSSRQRPAPFDADGVTIATCPADVVLRG